MAIDTQSPLAPIDESSMIENEIPAYRAVSARAVTSVVFGLASVFCFISLNFLLVVLGAVLFGWSALRAIGRYPDVLTGRRLAWTGMILGLVIGTSATARYFLEIIVLDRQASTFATQYVDVLKSESVASAVWYMQNIAYRKEKTPDAILEELKQVKTPPNFLETQTHDVENIKARLANPGQTIHFNRIENQLVDGLTHYANALIDLDGPPTEKFPASEEFALVELVKEPNAGSLDWKVRAIRYPYKPASLGLQAEHKDDDGHGHSH